MCVFVCMYIHVYNCTCTCTCLHNNQLLCVCICVHTIFPPLPVAADSGILQVQREDEGSLHVKDMPLDGLVILEVPCTSPTVPVGPTLSVHPTLPVGGAEACQKTANINEPWSVIF